MEYIPLKQWNVPRRIMGLMLAGAAAVRLHAFAGYGGVVLFALPYTAVFCACLYVLGMDESERGLVRSVLARLTGKRGAR